MSSTTRTTDIVVRFDGETGKLVTAMAQAERTVSQRVSAMGKSMERVGKNMTRYMALPIIGFLGASVKMSMDFEQTLTRMQTLAGKTADEVAAMRPQIVKLATTYGKSAQEAAEAMYFVASSGIEASKGMEVLENSLLSSALGMGDTQVIADLLTSAIGAYGAEALSAKDATNFLMGAISEGKAEPDQLAEALGRVLPVASAMGVTFDQVAAGFAALSIGGTDAAESATQLMGVMNTLNKPGTAAEKTLRGMGLSSAMLRKQLKEKGLISLLDTLRTKFKGNTAAVAAVFGNVRALNGVLALTGAKWEKSKEIFSNVLNADMIGRNKAILEESPAFKQKQAVEGLKNAMIDFGIAVTPALVGATDALKGFNSAMSNLSSGQKSFIVKMGGIVVAVSLVVSAVGKLIGLFERIAALLAKFPKVGAFLGKFLPGVAGATGVVTGLKVADKVLGADAPKAAARRAAYAASQRANNPISIAKGNDLDALRYIMMQRKIQGTRAIGGTVNGGSSYLVGERGPELFTPSSSGYISANGTLGGGSGPVNVVVNVSGSVIHERDLAIRVRDEIAQLMRRRGQNPSILGV